MLLILKQRNKMIRIEFLPVFVFGILPIMGGIIQASFYGILLAWSSCAFSLIIVYTFLQQRMINIDNLTGVWTRDSFQNYFLKRVKVYKNSNFGLVFIDMDGLKGINDEYGHCEGDIAIQAAAKLIKESVNIGDVVARFGGDEFIIVIDCSTKEELDKKVNRISKAFDDYNKKSEKVYKIDYSVGYDIYTFGYKSIEQFIDHVDSLMYINKRTKKSIAG